MTSDWLSSSATRCSRFSIGIVWDATVPEGNGTVLDNSCLMFISNMLYLSLMDRMGANLPQFGDAEMRLAGL